MSQRAIDHLMGWRVLGQRHKERILPVGATITAIGELAHSSADVSHCKGAICGGPSGSVLVLQVSGCCQTTVSHNFTIWWWYTQVEGVPRVKALQQCQTVRQSGQAQYLNVSRLSGPSSSFLHNRQ